MVELLESKEIPTNSSYKVTITLSKEVEIKPIFTEYSLVPYGEHYYFPHFFPPHAYGNDLYYQLKLNWEKEQKDGESLEEDQKLKFEDYYQEKEGRDLLSLDPTKWQSQDHYAVLGLGKMRWRASQDDIKKAYRKKVLKHHPDKNDKKGNSNFFKCVQKAYEYLSDPEKRKLFDSVDPAFDDVLPDESIINEHTFFDIFAPIFKNYSHFSKIHPVPFIGQENSSQAEIDRFYKFWSNFDSWRSFELLDEEQPSEFENREERRWVEKQNKASRAKKKKEERAKILKLVDLAIANDPRLKKLKQLEKEEKERKKAEKALALKKAEEEAQKQKEKELELQKLLEKEKQEKEAERKKEREVFKKNLKSIKKQIRNQIRDSFNYFNKKEEKEQLEVSANMESIFSFYGDQLDLFQELSQKLSNCKLSEEAESLFNNVLFDVDAKKKEEAQEKIEKQSQSAIKENNQEPWSEEETKLLIKAVNMFPGGSLNRWDTIANYISQRCSTAAPLRTSAEIIQKMKQVKKGAVNIENLQTIQKPAVEIKEEPTSNPVISEIKVEPAPWTNEEQKLLETALKTYPSSGPKAYTGSDRWDKIAAMIPNRSKKEVINRVKEVIKAMKEKKNKST